jgi:cardiolipin synthase
MTLVRVAIPLLKGKRRFHIDKGRPWSVVEHAVLAALASEPQTVGQLAESANLPRRLVLEMLIRLMRAGWVVLTQRSIGVVFSPSPSGLSVVDMDELPIVPKRIKPLINFVIDKITGTLYRSIEFPFFEKHVLEERAERESVVWMEPRELGTYSEPAALVSTLLADDEKFIGVDPAGDRLVDRFALVSVRNGALEGLPKRAPPELSSLVREAALAASGSPAGASSPRFRPLDFKAPDDDGGFAPTIQGAFHLDDIVMGGTEHADLFRDTIRRARYRLIIHSTFISEDKFNAVRDALQEAAQRGVAIDILWGEDSEKTNSTATSVVVRKLRQEIDSAGFRSVFRVHPFSTRSHAKLLIADGGKPDRYFAVVGSCNWLSSGFHSFEASVRLRDPKMVANILDQLTALTLGGDGHWTSLTTEFAKLSSDILMHPVPAGVRADMAVVLGPQHSQYIRIARDTAVSRLFVTSHRLGVANRPAIIIPAIAAAEDRGITTKVYFGAPTGSYKKDDGAAVQAFASPHGIRVRSVHDPRLHDQHVERLREIINGASERN